MPNYWKSNRAQLILYQCIKLKNTNFLASLSLDRTVVNEVLFCKTDLYGWKILVFTSSVSILFIHCFFFYHSSTPYDTFSKQLTLLLFYLSLESLTTLSRTDQSILVTISKDLLHSCSFIFISLLSLYRFLSNSFSFTAGLQSSWLGKIW